MTVPPCIVTRLRLHRFRNYTEVTVRPGSRLTVIAGRNAQGKTNLLEGLATVALTRSPRAAATSDLLQWGSDGAQVEADAQRGGGSITLTARFERASPDGVATRRMSVDGKRRAAREVVGICPVVLFWPDDLQLVKAGPESRRRLLDVLLTQLDARAAAHLVRYRRVLEQRNALLHHLRAHGGSAEPLVGFTRELAHHGARVAVARAMLVAELAPLAAAALQELSGGEDALRLTYRAHHVNAEALCGDDAAEAALHAALARRSAEELQRGVTLVGPHRDDMEIDLNARPARHTASQGQQRSIVLACKIAEMRHVAAAAGVTPVVMLDDVVSELDAHRRAALLSVLAATPGQQVLLTTTDANLDWSMFPSVQRMTVANGTVTCDP